MHGGSERPRGRSRQLSVRWDEENLEENEKIKAEINPTPIDEAKTPWASPQRDDDAGAPMELQGRVSWEKADFERRSSGSHDVGHHLTMAEAVAQQESRDPAERRKFEDARKNHYNMRSVLALGRQLLEEDEEEDDEQGGANKTPANLQRQRAAKTPRASPQDDEGAGGKKRHRKLEEL